MAKKKDSTHMTRFALRPSASDRRRAKAQESKDYFEENMFCAQLVRRYFAALPTLSIQYSFDIDPEAPPTSSSNHTVKAILQTVGPYLSPTVYDTLKTAWNDYHMNGTSSITLEQVIDQINHEARQGMAYQYNG